MNINSTNINEAIYIYSYDKYMNSFKTNHRYYWGRQHKRAAQALGKPNLIVANVHN